MKKVFVIGSGTMGLDIAQAFATYGLDAIVRVRTAERKAQATGQFASRLEKRVSRGKMTREAADELISHVNFTTELEDAASCDLILEAIKEDVELKKDLLRKLDAICPENVIFATNTSSISITELASATKRADKFIGMHFFNPATVMKLVEVIRGANTSDATKDAVFALSESIGKVPVEVKESPGFVVNRILIPMINEAIGLYAEGIASVEGIDQAMQLGCNHPMGPLALGDLVGLDVVLAIMDTLFAETHDSKYRAHTLLRKMVRGGMLGRKTGRGFYDYNK